MEWTKVDFGKHKNKTLPYIVLTDPNWFFWSMAEGIWEANEARFKKYSAQVEYVAARARQIKIPKKNPENWEVNYHYDYHNRVYDLSFVKKGSACSGRCGRSKYLDLSLTLNKPFKETVYRRYVDQVVKRVIGNKKAYLMAWCEAFFNDDNNFVGFERVKKRRRKRRASKRLANAA